MNQYSKSVSIVAAGLLCLSVSAFAADGKAVYEQKCASCHGKDGKGNPKMATVFKVDNALLDMTKKATTDKSEAELVDVTKKGVGKMPAYEGKLTEAEIAASVSYMLSLAGGSSSASAPAADKPAAPTAAKADTGAAAGVYQSKCASCHGKDGKGNPSMAKVLKLDDAALDLTDAATQGKSEADLTAITHKGAGKMPAYEGKLKDGEITALSAYIKSLGGK